MIINHTFNIWVHFASSGFQNTYIILHPLQQIKAKCTLSLSIFVATHFRLQCEVIISYRFISVIYIYISFHSSISPSSLYPHDILAYYIPMFSAFFQDPSSWWLRSGGPCPSGVRGTTHCTTAAGGVQARARRQRDLLRYSRMWGFGRLRRRPQPS